MKVRTIRIEDDLWERIEKISKQLGCSKSDLIRLAVIKQIKKLERL